MTFKENEQFRDGASPTGRTSAHPPPCTRLRRIGLLVVALVGVGLLVAACGDGSSSPGGAAPGGSTTSNYKDAVAYAQCMRTHGVPNMPDPTSSGQFITKAGTLNGVSGVDQSSPQYASANKACEHLLPDGGQFTPAEQQQALAKLLKYAQCMRTHGVPNMPDPTTAGRGVGLGLPAGVDPNSPQYQSAEAACRSLQPGLGG